jgi:predicted N-acyltransferase
VKFKQKFVMVSEVRGYFLFDFAVKKYWCQAPNLWINFYPEKECLAPFPPAAGMPLFPRKGLKRYPFDAAGGKRYKRKARSGRRGPEARRGRMRPG